MSTQSNASSVQSRAPLKPWERQFNRLPPNTREKINRAAARYYRRKTRQEWPRGAYRGRKWFPADSEGLDCSRYRPPSIAFPYSYRDACRTALHCARMEGVERHHRLVLRRAQVLRTIDLFFPQASQSS